ncbi:MAG: hypothetical protein R3E31_07525 [Chloroflexota bacterium]
MFGWPPFLTLAFIWLPFLLRRPPWQDWALLLAAVGLVGVYVAFWASGLMYECALLLPHCLLSCSDGAWHGIGLAGVGGSA